MAVKSTDVHVALTQAAEASEGVALVQQAQGLVIRNKAQHEAAREFQKGAKLLRKKVVAHYAEIKGPLNTALTTVRDMEKRDLAPIDQAIDMAEKIDTGYVREQHRIEAEAREAERLKAEAAELIRRRKDAEAAETAALKLEASSAVLSEREQMVVGYVVQRLMATGIASPPNWETACRSAGYKDPVAAAARLIKSEKIGAAVDAQVKAARIRHASEAKQVEPVIVDVVTKQSEIVDGGLRTYYGCKDFDLTPLLARLAEADYIANPILRKDVERFLVPALETLMSAQARALKELFPQVWPMCRLDKRDGTTSR